MLDLKEMERFLIRNGKCSNDEKLKKDSMNREHQNFDFFHNKKRKQAAKNYCGNCPVKTMCAELGYQLFLQGASQYSFVSDGIWGGMTIREIVKRRTPNGGVLLQFHVERHSAQQPESDSPIAS